MSGECEPRTGTLVFAPVGSARLTREGTTNEDAPGHASAVAVSGKYGYVVVAHGDAARVMRTHEVAGKVAERNQGRKASLVLVMEAKLAEEAKGRSSATIATLLINITRKFVPRKPPM